MRLVRLLALLGCVLALGACGGGDGETSGETTAADTDAATTSGGAAGEGLKIGLVTDIGGLDDRSFNFLANRGLERAENDLGVEGRVVISKSEADYVPNLTTLAKQDYDLVIAVGFLMASALEKVAARYPDTNFAIIDFSQSELKGKPKNVRGLLFKEQEAGYLVGYLAGLLAQEEAGAKQVIGSVGGLKIPPVDRYIAGYQAGAKAANEGVTTLNAYSQDFVDQAKCKELALDQISRGAHVVFQVAGQCGLGALSAAQEKNVRGIGVDADQAYLGEHVATSALKKVDEAVFQTVEKVVNGEEVGGGTTVFGLAEGAVGLGKTSPNADAAMVEQAQAQQQKIIDGEITVPDTVK